MTLYTLFGDVALVQSDEKARHQETYAFSKAEKVLGTKLHEVILVKEKANRGDPLKEADIRAQM